MNIEVRKHSFLNGNIILGLGIILFGGLWLLNSLEAVPEISAFDYWPSLLILVGLVKLFHRPVHTVRVLWALFFIVIGTLLQLNNLEYIDFRFGDLWPFLIIAAGITVIYNGFSGRNKRNRCIFGSIDEEGPQVLDTDHFDRETVLGERLYRVTAQRFKNGKISTVMGHSVVDFTGAQMHGDTAVLGAETVMGHIEVRVPREWQAVLEGSPLLGAFENNAAPAKEPGKRLVIKGSAVMGQIDVKN